MGWSCLTWIDNNSVFSNKPVYITASFVDDEYVISNIIFIPMGLMYLIIYFSLLGNAIV